MIRSMTGMASLEKSIAGQPYKIDIRSYNHRFLDLKLKLAPSVQHLEDSVRLTLKAYLGRGRVEVNIKAPAPETNNSLETNPEALAKIHRVALDFEARFGRPLEISLRCLMNSPDIFSRREAVPETEAFKNELNELLGETCEKLLKMRQTEGENLKRFLIAHMEKCVEKIALIEKEKHAMIESYHHRLTANLAALGLSLDDQDPRVMQELGFCIDRCDISEELNRFKSHSEHFHSILNEKGPVGKKLDFLSQELIRETNTICSKSESAKVTQTAIEIKSEVESFREQVQNVE